MTNPMQLQGWISGILRRAVRAALGLAVLLAGVATQSAQGQTYSVLYSFGGKHGKWPLAGLVRDGKSNLYGTTANGGASIFGTVFKLDSTGKEKVLYSFCPGGSPCSDGCYPDTGLVRDKAGNLYGTANCGDYGFGAVFKLDMIGTLTVLYSFTGGADGNYGDLVRDEAGNLYGTTEGGGAYSFGTVFKLNTTGKYTVLYSFAGGQDGADPIGGLVLDSKGNLYGTTAAGGGGTYGTVFKVDTIGKETVLYRFKGPPDGSGPNGDLVRDEKGNFFGTTVSGGDYDNGAIFRLSASGAETVLHSFTFGADGRNPVAALVRDRAGDFYGTTLNGGISGCNGYGCGVVFKLDTTGAYTVVHRFTGGTGGASPYANLILDQAGNLYGTTSTGGDRHAGTVFKLSP